MKSKKYVLLIASALIVFAGVSIYMSSANNSIASNAVSFSDVKESDWFYNDVQGVSEKGFMTGTGDSTFSPYENATRGMIVTILWRLEGEPYETGNSFSDVVMDAYYHDAVAWASNHQIVNGYDETIFGANDATTREQMVTIIYRYAEYKGYDVTQKFSLDAYEDKNQISEYAVEAIEWSYANGIISGTSDTMLSPKDPVQRCQVAAILERLYEKFSLTDIEGELNNENNNSQSQDVDETVIQNEGENSSDNDETSSNIGGGNSSGVGSGIPGGTGGFVDDNEDTTPNEDVVSEPQPAIKVNTVYGKPGDIIEVDLELQENPGILGMVLSLEYDETAMRLIDAKNGEAVSDVLTLTSSNTLNSGVRFVWDGLDLSSSDIKNGTLLTLEFELLDSAIEGKRYPLNLQYDTGDIVDADLNVVNLSIYQGFIEIEQSNED